MKPTAKSKPFLAAAVILLIAVTALFFIIPFPKNAASYIIYGFTVLSFIALGYIAFVAFDGAESRKSRLYGFPILRVGLLYTAAQLIACVVICLVAALVPAMPAWVSAVIGIALFALAAIGMLAANAARDTVEGIERESEKAASSLKYFRLDAEGLAALTSDETLKKKLSALAEKVRYSDPVSSDATESIEADIREQLGALKALLRNGGEGAENAVGALDSLLDERNRLCKAFKK